MTSAHYVIVSGIDAENAYLARGYKLSERTAAELLGTEAFHSLERNMRTDLVLMELPADEHAKRNAPERAYRPRWLNVHFLMGASVEAVDVLERGSPTSVVAPSIEGAVHAGYATGDCETNDLHLTSDLCAQSMERTVRDAIDQHLDAIAALREFLLESK